MRRAARLRASLVLALPFLLLSQLHAQAPAAGVLRGRVLDRSTGQPISSAEIGVSGHAATATSDSDGRWSLPQLAPGGYLLRVRRIGYAPVSLLVSLASGDTSKVEVRLTPSALPLDEIVITAARREQRLADVTVPTEIITRESIEATGASSLAAALTEQTGIQFDGGHPSGAGVMLQGLSNERVLVLVDGQPLYGRISGTLDLARVPTAIVDRVEIVKGPQAALYGSEAMGGVVNVVTRSPEGVGLNGGARAVAGSGGRREAGASGELRTGELSALVDVGRRDVDRAAGRPDETGALAERFDVIGRVSWRPDSAFALETSTLVLDERQRWPSGTQFDFADNTQVNVRVAADWRLGAHRLRPTIYLSRFEHLARRSGFSQPIAGTGDRQDQRLVEAELLYGTRVFGQALDAGLEVKQERIGSTDGRIEGGTRTLYSAEPFAQLDWSGARWSVVPGLRLSWNERWGSTLTPRLALRYRMSNALSVRVGAGRGFRAPDFKELYLQFINDAAGYAVYGNHDLRPEHSTNLTGGVEWTGGRLYGRAQLFWNDLRDFIETRPMADDGSGLLLFQYANVARARTYGAELEAGVVLPSVRLEAGYARLGTEDAATGRPLLGRPEHSGRMVTTVAPTRALHATVSGIYTGATPMERGETGAITSEREAFLRIDARVAQRLPWGLELSLGADNIFDRRPDAWADAVGREWYLGLTWLTTSLLPD
jgi:outer membrane receptor for ferrienterochelin and colicins